MDQNQDHDFKKKLKKGHLLINHLEEMQYSYFNGRPNWTTLQKNDLKLYLACIYYGNPSNAIVQKKYEENNNAEEIFGLYEKKIKEKISDLYDLIEKKYINSGNFNNIEVGVSMVHSICKNKCEDCQKIPEKDIHKWILIRLKLNNSKLYFIDFELNRTYTDWDEYLNDNNLPEGYMFFPISGIFDASKSLCLTITPASKKIEKVFKKADSISDMICFTGNTLLGSSLIFPIAMPIAAVLTVGTLTTATCAYQFIRATQRLIDMSRHNIRKSGIKYWKTWLEFLTAAFGTIATPLKAITAIKSEVNSVVLSAGKTFTVFRRSACITQCTLEAFVATLDIIDNNFKITKENILKLSLNVFIVTGSFMPSSYIKDILKVLSMQAVWMPIYKSLEQIPYCLGQHFWNSVYFFKKHFDTFVEQVITFFAENLTVNNLLFAWKNVYRLFDGYQKQTSQLDVGDLLRHIVDDIALHECVKYVLRGQSMVKLLDSLRDYAPKKPIGRALVKYCVDHVLQEAMKLSAMRDDCVAELARFGETNSWKIEEEFCKEYGLERCAMDQYVLWAISQVNAATLMAMYEEYASRPENMFDDDMVAHKRNSASWSAKGYTLVVPCGILDLKMCLQFAKKINPQPHQYLDHKLVQPEPGVSLMFEVSAFSVNIVFFGIDQIDGVSKMNICFFNQNCDSGSSPTTCHGGLRKLQEA